jgi:hypothetical protein
MGNAITDSDIKTAALHLREKPSIALYALRILWLRMFPLRY